MITLFYDDQCSLCLRFKEALKRLNIEEQITSYSIHDEQIYSQFPMLNRDACHKQVHIITENNTLLAGPDAISYLVKKNPQIEKIAWLIDSEMGQKSIAFFYSMAEKYRKSSLNKCHTCK